MDLPLKNYRFVTIRRSIFYGWLIVCLLPALYACTSLKSLSIQVAVPPQYPISEDVQSLALLNRSMNGRFTNLPTDSLEKMLIGNKMSLDTIFRDSIAADTTIRVAAQALFESGRFDAVIPKERNIMRTDNNENTSPLDSTFVNAVCNDFKVDALLVLEKFEEHLNTRYYLYGEGVFDENREYGAVTDLAYRAEWRLYRRNNQPPVKRFLVADSIFWRNYSYSLEDLYSRMPKTKEALIGGGIEAALKITEFISPKWINQTRYYFLTGKDEIDAAIPMIINNKWEEAAAIWSKFANVDAKSIRSKVEYNLALAAEMNGDIDLAIEWGLKSFNTRYSKAAEVYLKKLDTIRIAKLKENKTKY